MTDSAHCYLFTALPCEAKPLISHFKLKKELSISAFTVYRNAEITLTVTGLGKSAMAAGVAYTLALFPSERLAVLLNIGVAGQSHFKCGSVFIADKVTDHDTGRHFYPQLLCTPSCASHSLVTVAQPELTYRSDALYDMEASAFYETAVRFSSSELIHCLKIISDNADNPSTNIKPVQVSQWITDALPVISNYRQQLIQIAMQDQPFSADHYAQISQQWRFSSTESVQLKRLLNKRAVLMPQLALDIDELLLVAHSGKQVLNYLRDEIAEQDFGGFE